MLPKSENRYTTYWKKKNFDPNFKSQVEKSIIDDEIGELKTQGVKDAIAQLHQEGKITIKTFKSNDKQTIRRLDGNEYATLRLLCFWLGCWLRWGFNIICLFICRCSFYLNRDNCILGMLLEPRIELLVWNTLVNTKGIN